MVAAVFPGQGSQKPGMGKELYESNDAARLVFREVSRAAGVDMQELCFNADEETLRQTQNAQLALYTVGVAAFESLRGALPELQFQAVAGHSVGEYAALAAAGVVPIPVGAKLVKKRGEVMAEAGKTHPGTMAAVLGLERAALDRVCADVGGVVVVANDNCPGQLVISGEVDAVKRASDLATERGAKRVLPLNVSGAFHSPLMEAPAAEMAKALEAEQFRLGEYTVYANVTAEPALDAERWPRLLEDQLRSPVRWTETTQNMIRDGVDTFIECGPGEVLSGLIRRISKDVRTMNVGDNASLERSSAALRT
ncbi:MAG: [acyl-carrier-protein] S-malonyltransferase [Fimbriimonadaceae bacterium]|jgi:[acyl-carrier-protein] S-malonyltransferase|nr:[acyl-carrier-protein] S-malonyltransferase [Fimbriimonadaceae bacterium]